jgi:hypothetical protein
MTVAALEVVGNSIEGADGLVGGRRQVLRFLLWQR